MDLQMWGAVFRLVIFLPLVAILAYLLVRLGLGRRRLGSGHGLQVMEQMLLSPRATISVIRVNQRYFLVASGDGGTRLLAELDDYSPPMPADNSPFRFAQILKEHLRTGRRQGDEL